MTLTHPDYLILGIGAAILIAAGLLSQARRRRRLAAFLGGRSAGRRLAGRDLHRLPLGRIALLGLAAAGIATAAAEPRIERETIEEPDPLPVQRVMFAIDISASMQAADTRPTRLGAAMERVRQIMAARPEAEYGVLLFAGQTYPLAQPTGDHVALEYLIQGITPTIASAWDPGSTASLGIDRAARLVMAPADSNAIPAIIVISDGEFGERMSSVVAAVEAAREAGIAVHAMGAGTARGSGMSLTAGDYQLGGPVLTEDGEPAFSRMREETLREIASAGGGLYAHATDDAAIQALIDVLEPETRPLVEAGDAPLADRFDLANLLIVLALGLVLLESLLDVRIPGIWRPFRRPRSLRPTPGGAI